MRQTCAIQINRCVVVKKILVKGWCGQNQGYALKNLDFGHDKGYGFFVTATADMALDSAEMEEKDSDSLPKFFWDKGFVVVVFLLF